MERKAQSLSYVDIRRCTSTYVVRASTYVHARRHRHRRQRRGTDFEQERVRGRETTRKSAITPNPLKSLSKPGQIPPKIPPKPPKIEAKSSPDPSKSAFEVHPKYKQEKTMPKIDPRGRQSLQTSPKTLPKPLPKRAPDPSKCPF